MCAIVNDCQMNNVHLSNKVDLSLSLSLFASADKTCVSVDRNTSNIFISCSEKFNSELIEVKDALEIVSAFELYHTLY